MITTECWSIVDYKDWPLLEWDWVKECTAHGLRYAASKGQWLATGHQQFLRTPIRGHVAGYRLAPGTDEPDKVLKTSGSLIMGTRSWIWTNVRFC